MTSDASALDAIAAEIAAWKNGVQDAIDTAYNIERIVVTARRVLL